jgi:hypothetical protein
MTTSDGTAADRGVKANRSDGLLRLVLAVLTLAATTTAGVAAAADPPFATLRGQHDSYASTDVQSAVTPQIRRSVTAIGASGAGLTINATFDSSITSNPNVAAIEAMLNAAVSVFESTFSDPIVVSILFRYSTTYADGSALPAGLLASSQTGLYVIPWNSFIGALTADATTTNDTSANATLPGSALTTSLVPSSANGRAVGLSTPSIVFANGSIGQGGPYDGIVTVNSNQPFSFTRPPAAGTYDAQRSVEHEIDEILGLGSSINSISNLRPQDLFSWSSAGVRSESGSGTRYFSIDGGTTDLVGFNQNSNGDYGDWISPACPQANPFVQNAFSCKDQVDDVAKTSPEGINLDVIGYDLATGASTTSTTIITSTTVPGGTTTTTLQCQPPQVECCPVGQPGCGVCGTDCGNGGCCGPSAPVCDNDNGTCLVCASPQIECCPGGVSGCGVCGTDCGNGGCCPPADPVCDNANGVCLAQGSCAGTQVQCTDSALGFSDTACCDTPQKKSQCAAACGPIITACKASCTGGRHAKKCVKRCRTVLVNRCKKVKPHSCG